MSWMGCVATSVMGPRINSLSEESSGPLHRMPQVWQDGIVIMNGILDLSKRNRSLLLNILLPLVYYLDGESKTNEMQAKIILLV
jgi:hypothetical protein